MNYPLPRRQTGFSLIEALIAILIFSIGVVGMLNMQATAIELSTDARYRSQAAFLADQLLARITLSDPDTLAQLSHHPNAGNNGDPCDPQGAASTNTTVTHWLAEVANNLPDANADYQRVSVDTGAATVAITLCWLPPGGTQHSYTVVNMLQL